MKFGFIAKHRGIWPADWLCGALGVSARRLLCRADTTAQSAVLAAMKSRRQGSGQLPCQRSNLWR
jgi:hypothetical protein